MTLDKLEKSPTFIDYCHRVEAPAQLDGHYRHNHHQTIRTHNMPTRHNRNHFHHTTPPFRSVSSSSQNSIGHEKKKAPVLFKTSMCVNWLAGNCRFYDRCWYAHGHTELKQYENSPKTELVPLKYADRGAVNNATRAQQHWMSMSSHMRSKTDPTRFARESIAAQFRAGVEARLKEDEEKTKIGPVEKKICLKFTYIPDPTFPVALPDGDSKEFPKDAAAILDSLTFLKIADEFTNIKEECPFYSSGGFCPLGDDCFLEHKVPSPDHL